MKSQHSYTAHRSRMTSAAMAAVAAGAALSVFSTPAYGIAEAINDMCTTLQDRLATPAGVDPCVWYRDDLGFVINERITGSRTVFGLIDGLFAWAGHDAFVDVENSPPGETISRIQVEIDAGLGDPVEGNLPAIQLATAATSSLGAAIGYGERDAFVDFPSERPLAQGVAWEANALTASVASQIFSQERFNVNDSGLLVSMLIMADPETAARFDIAQPADVILSNWSNAGGDFSGDGFIAKLHDAIAHMFGTVLIAPTGDGGGFSFPDDSEIERPEFLTVGMPAGAFNVIGVGAMTVSVDGAGFFAQYDTIAPFTGKGELDFRNYSTFEGIETPGGYGIEERSRYGVDFMVPGDRLRLPVSEFGDEDQDIAPTYPYSRGPEIPDEPDDDDEMINFGSMSTRYAAGIGAGVALLVQDAYRSLDERRRAGDQTLPFDVLAWPDDRTGLPNYVMRALLCTGVDKTAAWTNAGERGQSEDREPVTTQPVDLTEGTGVLKMDTLYEIFNGAVADPTDPNSAPRPATMDSPFTPTDIALVRVPTFGAGGVPLETAGPTYGFGGDQHKGEEGPYRSFFGGEDPDLGDPGSNPGADVESGREPTPDRRPQRPPQSEIPIGPNQVEIVSAIPVQALGWDQARLGVGDLDYEVQENTDPGQQFFATLCWNRTLEVDFPEISPECLDAGNCGVFGFPFSELALEFEDLNLEVWLSDGSGNPTIQVGASETEFDNREHVILEQVFFTSKLLIRVTHESRIYDRYRNQYAGDIPFGLAWRLTEATEDLTQASTGIPGDLNSDGRVDFSDLNAVLQAFGSDQRSGDANGDGKVDFADLNLVLTNMSSNV